MWCLCWDILLLPLYVFVACTGSSVPFTFTLDMLELQLRLTWRRVLQSLLWDQSYVRIGHVLHILLSGDKPYHPYQNWWANLPPQYIEVPCENRKIQEIALQNRWIYITVAAYYLYFGMFCCSFCRGSLSSKLFHIHQTILCTVPRLVFWK